jgi:hypothetical protein
MSKYPGGSSTRGWIPVKPNEVHKVIRAAKNKSTPGDDHIVWRYLKKAMKDSLSFTMNMAVILNVLVLNGRMPTSLKHTETVIIPKPNKPDYSRPKAWRLITLLSCIAKTFMGIFAKRFQHDTITFKLVHPNQYSGLMGKSTVDAGLLLAQHMAARKANGMYTSILAIDIAQLFPSI